MSDPAGFLFPMAQRRDTEQVHGYAGNVTDARMHALARLYPVNCGRSTSTVTSCTRPMTAGRPPGKGRQRQALIRHCAGCAYMCAHGLRSISTARIRAWMRLSGYSSNGADIKQNQLSWCNILMKEDGYA